MNHNNPLKTSLMKQLAYIDQNRFDLLELYLSSAPDHRKDYKFFDKYVSEVEEFLLNFDSYPSPSKIFIGCSVTLHFEDDNINDRFTICFPEQSDPDKGYISFLSPVGRQLLLCGMDENISLVTPSGETRVTITGIGFDPV